SILTKFGASASLAYWGNTCRSGRLDFPKVRRPQNKIDSPVAALRDIFANDPRILVTQDDPGGGIIRVAEADVPQNILHVRISHLSFKTEWNQGAVYSVSEALSVIQAAREVESFKTKHDIEPYGIQQASDVHPATPSPDLPHISGSLEN